MTADRSDGEFLVQGPPAPVAQLMAVRALKAAEFRRHVVNGRELLARLVMPRTRAAETTTAVVKRRVGGDFTVRNRK